MPKNAATLARLRSEISALELGGYAPQGLQFGHEALDGALPRTGLALAAVHEIAGDEGAARSFAALIAGRLAGVAGTVLWVAREAELYGAGLAEFGCAPERLILVRARVRADLLAAMEDGLRSGALGSVVGELPSLDLVAARRLQIAAAAGRTTGLIVRPALPGAVQEMAQSGIAVTRWRVEAAPSVPPPEVSRGVGRPRWHVELMRARGGIPGRWMMEWDNATRDFAVVSELLDRSGEPLPADWPVGTGGWRHAG